MFTQIETIQAVAQLQPVLHQLVNQCVAERRAAHYQKSPSMSYDEAHDYLDKCDQEADALDSATAKKQCLIDLAHGRRADFDGEFRKARYQRTGSTTRPVRYQRQPALTERQAAEQAASAEARELCLAAQARGEKVDSNATFAAVFQRYGL